MKGKKESSEMRSRALQRKCSNTILVFLEKVMMQL